MSKTILKHQETQKKVIARKAATVQKEEAKQKGHTRQDIILMDNLKGLHSSKTVRLTDYVGCSNANCCDSTKLMYLVGRIQVDDHSGGDRETVMDTYIPLCESCVRYYGEAAVR